MTVLLFWIISAYPDFSLALAIWPFIIAAAFDAAIINRLSN